MMRNSARKNSSARMAEMHTMARMFSGTVMEDAKLAESDKNTHANAYRSRVEWRRIVSREPRSISSMMM